MDNLISKNNLVMRNELWVKEEATVFGYTDGDASEIHIQNIVANAKDLTSQSGELESSYPKWDWVSEYHLSGKRSNLLRGLDLSEMENVLEIGCGCGAISRYLGENKINVDAVEGSNRRAKIAQLRCRDLQNVKIINANFNGLELPENKYDAIFVIGVIEYAGKFMDDFNTDEACVIWILDKLNKALVDGGVLIIAIENRNGMKYWLGATEDHFGQPYIGITNYWGRKGIRTYTLNQWKELLDEAGYQNQHYLFPFPDYKLPQVILDETFIDNDEYAYNLLYRIESRDYLKPWRPEVNEFAIWRSLHEDGRLKQFSNSFLIVSGKSRCGLERVVPNDFTYFSGGSRKPEYRTVTIKRRNADKIVKRNVMSSQSDVSGDLSHLRLCAPYIKGRLLSTLWVEAALSGRKERFDALLSKYYKFLNELHSGKNKTEMVDALPANIIVDRDGGYNLFDQEWKNKETVAVEYIMFRAVLFFCQNNQKILQPFYKENNIHCIAEFIRYGFAKIGIDLGPMLGEFVEKEEALQFQVSEQDNLTPIWKLLAAPVKRTARRIYKTSLFWTSTGRSFSKTNRQEITWDAEVSDYKLRFVFCSKKPITRLRLKPVNVNTFFKLRSISLLYKKGVDSDSVFLLHLNSMEEIKSKAVVDGATMEFVYPDGIYFSRTGEAVFEFAINDENENHGTKGVYECIVELADVTEYECSWPDEHFNIEKEKFRSRINQLHNRMAEKDHYAKGLNKQIEELQDLRFENNEEKHKNIRLTRELDVVKSELATAKNNLKNLSALKALRALSTALPGKYGWISESLKHFERPSEEYEKIKRSGLFDTDFYRRQETELCAFGEDPLLHYIEIGVDKGLNPHRLFNTRYYLSQISELAVRRVNPLAHYLESGACNGLNPCYLFDSRYYLDENPQVAEAGINPLVHYITEGAKAGCDPHPAFDTEYYFTRHPEAFESQLSPLEHFLLTSDSRKESPTILFDPEFYLSNRSDVAETNISAFYHYMEKGCRERGSDPRLLFNTKYYFQLHPHLEQQRKNPLTHFIKKGQYEEKGPHPLFDLSFYRDQVAGNIHPAKDPLSHYLLTGHEEKVNPHPLFDSMFYSRQLESIKEGENIILEHYIKKGAKSRISPHPLFDCGYYLSQFDDTSIDQVKDLMLDYYEKGVENRKNPHPLFDVKYYLTQMEDCEKKEQNPLEHYTKKGMDLGLSTHPDFDVTFYQDNNRTAHTNYNESPIVHYIYEGGQTEKWPNPEIQRFSFKPTINLALIVDGPDFRFIPGTVLSIMSQLYPRWKLTVAIRNPDTSAGYLAALALAEKDRRISIMEIDDDEPFVRTGNKVLKNFSGEFICFMDEHIYLHAEAMAAFVRELNKNNDLTLIHSRPPENNNEAASYQKLCSGDHTKTIKFFVGPLAIFKRSVIDQLGGFESWHQGIFDNRFLINFVRSVPHNSVVHIDKALHYTM